MARYALGVVWLLVAVGPALFAAVRLRARYLPSWRGAEARLADIVIAIGTLVLVSEALGAVGWFRRWPIAVGLFVVGTMAGLISRPVATGPGGRGSRATASTSRRVQVAAALLAVGCVVALWSVQISAVLAGGPVDTDTQTYHLPHAATFVQTGSLTDLYRPTVDDAVPYHPANGELFHAAGMLAFGTDILSAFINIVWLLVLFLGAWVVGEDRDQGPAAVVGAAAPLAVPVMWTTQGGSAMTDVFAIAMLVATVAFLVRAEGAVGPVLLAAASAGLAIGSKLTMGVPLGVLTIALLVVSRSAGYRFKRFAALWIVPLMATGSFWYFRNLFRVGNPIPSVRLGVGPVALPKVPMLLVDRYGYSVSDYATNADVWRRYFLPGLARGLGDLWPLLIVLAAAGLIGVVVRRREVLVRALAVSAILSAIGYAFTPTTALGFEGEPTLFVGNLRYLIPSLVMALVIAPAAVSDRSAACWIFIAGCLATLVPVVVDASGSFGTLSLTVGAGVVLAAVAAFRMSSVSRRSVAVASGVLVVVVSAGGYLLQERYVDRRFSYTGTVGRGTRDPAAFRWAQRIHDANIGIAGFFLNYPLFGADVSNRVSYVGDLQADHRFTDHASCAAFLTAVNAGGYDYVVTMPPFPDREEPDAARWMRTATEASRIVHGDEAAVFRIDGELDPSGCPPTDDGPTPRSAGSRRADPGTAR